MKLKPSYDILDSTDEYQVRMFKEPKALFWHRDKEDREVELLHGDVKIQFDNELPIEMKFNKKYKINKYTYHRIISYKLCVLKIYFKNEK